MTSDSSASGDFLTRSRGYGVAAGGAVILKGCLEADTPIARIYAPRSGRGEELLEAARAESVREAMRAHDMRVQGLDDVSRAFALAQHDARRDLRSLVIIPADAKEEAAGILAAWPVVGAQGANVCVVFEGSAVSPRGTSSIRIATDAGFCVLTVSDLPSLRRMIEKAYHLGRAGRCATAIVIDRSILDSAETLPCQPNRVTQTIDVDALIERRRRRRFRAAEGEDIYNIARRLDLNAIENLPSPGERVELGIVQVGPAGPALRHLLHEFQLVGRLPVLDLTMIAPLDHSAIERLLERCRRVVVLEPRLDEIESRLLEVAEACRRRGGDPASIWGRTLPSDEAGQARFLEPGDVLSPSTLGRKIVHLLHAIRPSHQIRARLVADPLVWKTTASSIDAPSGGVSEIRQLLEDVAEWGRSLGVLAEEAGGDDDDAPQPVSLVIDGRPTVAGARSVECELWSAREFARRGRAAIVQMVGDSGDWMMIVHAESDDEASGCQRLLDAFTPPDRAGRITSIRHPLADRLELRLALRDALRNRGITVVFITTRSGHARTDLGELETDAEIDAAGFQRVNRFVHPADHACNVREGSPVVDPTFQRVERKTQSGVSYAIDRLPPRLRAQFRLRMRPLFESVSVIRAAPLLPQRVRSVNARFPAPLIVHGSQATWRAHLLGTRGSGFGLCTEALIEAGAIEGYHVRAMRTGTGDDGVLDAQVLFSRLATDGAPLPLSPRVPYGELDVMIAADAARLHSEAPAIAPTCDPQRTACIIDNDRADPLEPLARALFRRDWTELRDVSHIVERVFGTARPCDIVLLGLAFQRGWIPLSAESIEGGVARIEARGFRRLRDAFDLGRTIALDASFLKRERSEDLSLARMVRRSHLVLHLESGRTRRLASDFRRTIESAIDDLPGLKESEAGRQSLGDFVRAMDRLVRRAGMSEARLFRDLIVNLYQHDRGGSGRALTRHAILPLATAMLVRDAHFLATMALSLEARRMARARLNVQASRGDEMVRRFLNRFEAVGFGWRLRVDFRSSDWTASVVKRFGSLWPQRWRGSMADRARRRYVIDLVERAARGAGFEYEVWERRMHELYDLAERQRLPHFSARALEMVLEPRRPRPATRDVKADDGDRSIPTPAPGVTSASDDRRPTSTEQDAQEDTGMPVVEG